MSEARVTAWKCGVCGYVHQGLQPPEECPICGAAREEFEPYEELLAVHPGAPSPSAWQCLVCGHLAAGEAPPAECPTCGAARESFEPLAEPAAAGQASGRRARVVIVGAGVAGLSAAESLRAAVPRAEVTLISREADLPYYRLNLTRYLAGEVTEDDLPIHPLAWYDEHGIRLLLGADVGEIDLEGKRVALRAGGSEPFDQLILAAGAHPFIPPIPGADKEGVFSLRTVGHARRLLEAAASGARCVCIGGGILGLETAGALARRGARTTLLEGFPWLLPRQLNRRAAELLAERVAGMGIGLRAGVRVAEIAGDGRATAVRLESDEQVPADLVVITAGVRANSRLARTAGLHVNQGVVVDDYLVTSHPDVLAAGDVAEHRGVLYGIWPAAKYQGSIAGLNAAGVKTQFAGIARSNTLKVLGIDLFSIGQVEATDGAYRALEAEDGGRYLRFLFRDGLLVGAVLLGDTTLTPSVKSAVENRTDLSGLLARGPSAADVAAHLARLTAASKNP